ncbi:MAG: hypothetical protein COU22_02020 [Candidatus Komeilibacteria bacterium CG10_big_fil_rev_8_21_14_0_10_41_13]|uniref:ATP phosphoribosyltransferase catalytic domain-containing protein n=1 Tax=Candidatus Komeilibacteria bacterium CG10_big_fil_rev_8_21_14_0_10_41_13 TaxID=1974476 RepID=A0A2M6WCF0_9BACT|nr:MAG: hypothetical protein COU22_02020 [Candidatus Komeilibacteria bacterium CG10_big_fil_rev_8_21_14_0_10_41_13]
MRIGIPNRSSFLHIGAISQCVFSGILPQHLYHPAKLFYKLDGYNLLLCRCSELCKLFLQRDIDLIFVGDDYAKEYLPNAEYEKISFSFLKVYFALLCSDIYNQRSRFDKIFTKFPVMAAEYLQKWSIGYNQIEAVSGASECFACSVSNSAAFDVICSGITQQENGLSIIRNDDLLGCSWYFSQNLFPDSLRTAISNQNLFNRILDYYKSVLNNHSDATKIEVQSILGSINKGDDNV